MIDEAMEKLEINGWTCDILNCVCSGDNPVCEYQENQNDPDRMDESDEEMESDEEESEDETDEEMESDESGYEDEVGNMVSCRDYD